jgi:hypothetical protein
MVRKYSSSDPVPAPDPMLAIPAYWVRPPQTLSNASGAHRFLWDLHYAPVPGVKAEYPIAAVPHNTVPQSTSAWVLPGQYMVVLTAGGKTYSQTLTVKMDPRVNTPATALARQFQLTQQLYAHLLEISPAFDQVVALREKTKDVQAHAQGEALKAVKAFEQKLEALADGAARRPGPADEPATLGSIRTRMLALLTILQDVDDAPTTQATAAVAELEKSFPPVMARWKAIQSQDLPALNSQLRQANLPELKLEANPEPQESGGNRE